MKTLPRLLITGIAFTALNVALAQPVLVSPTNQTCSLGATAVFQVRVTSGSPPYTYAWQHNDIVIDPAANPSAATARLSITNASLLDAGQYRVAVIDATGTATSNPAELRVDTTFTKITQGPLVTDRQPTGGATWGDYDNDGRLDLFVANTGDTYRNSLYRNLGGDEFVKVTNALTTGAPGNSWGAQWADADNDGNLDLFILRPFTTTGFPNNQDRNAFFRNQGGGGFTPMTNAATWVKGFWTDATWVDHDGDGFLDLLGTTQSFEAGQSLDDYCWRNLADGRFAAWTADDVGVVLKPEAKTAGPAWCDIDGDGDLDLYVSNIGARTNFLYRNDGGRMVPVTAGSLPAARSTWGATWADFNNDGRFDLFTGGENGTNSLHLNRGNWVFEDVTVASGLVLSGSVYAPAAGDFDNDGDVDLYVARYNGGADVLYMNRGDGTFDPADVGSPLTGTVFSGAMWVDYNNDGFLDLFQFRADGTPAANFLYRNTLSQYGNTNHWLKLRLKGTASNASAIGARVWAKATIDGKEAWQVRQLTVAALVAPSPEGLVVHFGLGDATVVDLVRIEWPSGNGQELANVSVDQTLPLTVTEPVSITPVRPSASPNGSVTLTRSAVSGATYQWRFDGADLAGQTNRTLKLANIAAEQAGRYSVVASNGTTLVTNFVYLAVDATFTKIIEGPAVTDLGSSGYLAWGDYDRDGYPDLAVARWGRGTSTIYHNAGDGTFAPLPRPSFISATDGINPWGDLDNDGRLDLAVWNNAGTTLWFDDGGGASSPWPLGAGSAVWGTCAMVDYNRDGLLDLYFTSFSNSTNRLYRNDGHRSFTRMMPSDVGAVVSVAQVGGAASWADFDDDGWLDVYSGNFQGNRNLMFRSDGTGRYVAVTNLITRTTGPSLSGAWGDYDNDGRLDLCVVARGGTTRLYHNLGGAEFEVATGLPALTGDHQSASWADYDNDGFLDLFVAGLTTGNKLFRNNGNGSFTKVTTGSIANDRLPTGASSYAGMWLDCDRDGFLDLYVGNGDDNATLYTANLLYRNNPNGNHWLQVRLTGTTSNPQGIGAKVRAQARYAGQARWQRRDITAGDIYNGNNLYAQFGLGDATNVMTLRIEWPSGTVQEISNVAVDQVLAITEPRRAVLAVITLAPSVVTGTLTGDPNTSYEIDVADDVATGWTLLNSVTTDANGTAGWSDAGPAPQGRRFYRASKVP